MIVQFRPVEGVYAKRLTALPLYNQTLRSLLIDVRLTEIRTMELKTDCSLLLMMVSVFSISELVIITCISNFLIIHK